VPPRDDYPKVEWQRRDDYSKVARQSTYCGLSLDGNSRCFDGTNLTSEKIRRSNARHLHRRLRDYPRRHRRRVRRHHEQGLRAARQE
jgi:hypothetical protein